MSPPGLQMPLSEYAVVQTDKSEEFWLERLEEEDWVDAVPLATPPASRTNQEPLEESEGDFLRVQQLMPL